MKRLLFTGFLVVLLGFLTPANALSVTFYTDRPAFEAAIGGPGTLEDFTSSAHYPISTGILNSATSLTEIGLLPGMIKPGVTYSTPIGTGFFFNIDTDGGYIGGFLDGFYEGDLNRKLTITFDNPVMGFGFDTNSIMGKYFDIQINFLSDSPVTEQYNVSGPMEFFGFSSASSDILSAIIGGQGNDSTGFAFALDNFEFGGTATPVPGPVTQVPEPATILLLGFGLVGIAGVRKFKK